MKMISRLATVMGAFVVSTTIASAAPVLFNYGNIVPATFEDFESFASPSSFGATASFNGFNASISGSLNPDLRIPASLNNFCGSATDKCLISQDTSGTRLFNGFQPNTTRIGMDITKIGVEDILQITVTGNSGTSVFSSDFIGQIGFSDPTGLISVGFENLGFNSRFGNYGFDDVVTSAAPIPAPASLPLLLGALGLLGVRVARRQACRA